MKFLHLTMDYPPAIGGVASIISNFAAHADPTASVVYAPRAQEDQMIDRQHAWKVYRKKQVWLFWPHWLPMLWQTHSIAKREQPTHLLVHQGLPLGYAALFVRWLLGVPYILFLHGTDLETALHRASKKKRLGKIIAGAERVVVASNFMAEKLKNNFTGLLPPITVFNPPPADYFFTTPVPTDIAAVKSELALNGKRVLLSVGRIVPGKGYPKIARLLPRLLAQFPDLVWVIIGDGSERAKLLDILSTLGVQHVVRFLGSVPAEKLPVYYYAADVVALLTHKTDQSEEGWGLVFAEAAAAGKAVVAGRVGGVPEVVHDQETGLVVDPNNDEQIFAALVTLLKDKTLAEAMGTRGRLRAESELTWQHQLAVFMKLYA